MSPLHILAFVALFLLNTLTLSECLMHGSTSIMAEPKNLLGWVTLDLGIEVKSFDIMIREFLFPLQSLWNQDHAQVTQRWVESAGSTKGCWFFFVSALLIFTVGCCGAPARDRPAPDYGIFALDWTHRFIDHIWFYCFIVAGCNGRTNVSKSFFCISGVFCCIGDFRVSCASWKFCCVLFCVFLLLKLKSEELMLFFTSLTMMSRMSWFGKIGLGKQMI